MSSPKSEALATPNKQNLDTSQGSSQRLRLGALTALVVGSMIGGGIFSLPQNMAASADVGAVLIGWGITAVGMLALAFVFQTLANRKPELDGGIFAYAKAGFGDYMGFSSAWGYWISAWLGNVGYYVLLFSTLGYFFPVFGQGNTVVSIICASVILWSVHLLILRGIKEAAFINQITTVAKVVPLVLYILILLFAFRLNISKAQAYSPREQRSDPILVPYLWSASYALALTLRGETYERAEGERDKDRIVAAIAVVYAVWLLYAGGLKYVLLSAMLYAPGAILFAKAKRERGLPVFTNIEKVIFAGVAAGALVAAYGLYDGFLSL